MSWLRNVCVALLSVAAVGCGSSKSPSAATPLCSDDAGSGVCVTHVTGVLADTSGAVVQKAPVSVCGNVCYFGQTDAKGHFDVAVGAHIVLADYFLLIHQRPLHACFYYPLPATAHNGMVDLGTRPVLTLPTDGPAVQVRGAGAPAQSLTSGDVTLDVPAGVDVQADPEDLQLGAKGLEFRALSVPASERATFIDPSLGALALYAVGPFEAAFFQKGTATAAKASLSFKNTTSLAAGTPVELLAMGSYVFPSSIKPGSFAPVATGQVSSDGQSVTLDAGQGIQYLTWVAIREKK